MSPTTANSDRLPERHAHAGRFLSDAGPRSQAWFAGTPYFSVPHHSGFDHSPTGIVLRARSLVELDDRVSSGSIAFWATWLSGARLAAERILCSALALHGTDGSAAVLALTRALGLHLQGDLRGAMDIYPLVAASRIGVFQRAAVTSSALLMTLADDRARAAYWLDLASDEEPNAIASAFERLLQTRREREGAAKTEAIARKLTRTIDSNALDPAEFAPVMDC